MANFLGPKREAGDPIPFIYFAIQETDPKKLKVERGQDRILTAARGVPAQLGIDPTYPAPSKNFLHVDRYEEAPLPKDAIDYGYGIGVLHQIPCRAKALATP